VHAPLLLLAAERPLACCCRTELQLRALEIISNMMVDPQQDVCKSIDMSVRAALQNMAR
jgi:hypothetical protein